MEIKKENINYDQLLCGSVASNQNDYKKHNRILRDIYRLMEKYKINKIDVAINKWPYEK